MTSNDKIEEPLSVPGVTMAEHTGGTMYHDSNTYFAFDYACPWSFLSYLRISDVFQSLRKGGPRLVHYGLRSHLGGPSQSHPLVPPLAVRRQLRTHFEAEGLAYPLNARTSQSKTEKAQKLEIWARGLPLQADLNVSFFSAYHLEGADLDCDSTILKIAERAGLGRTAYTEAQSDPHTQHILSAHGAFVDGLRAPMIPILFAGERRLSGLAPRRQICEFARNASQD